MGTILTSCETGWSGLVAELFALDPGSLSIESSRTHRISVHVGRPHRLWEWRDGTAQEGPHRHGDVVVTAAGEARRVRWDRPTSFLTLKLEAQLVGSVAQSMDLNPDAVRIVGRFSGRDPQLEHLGLGLLHELETGAPSGPLYGDSLATALAVRLLTHYSEGRTAVRRPASGLTPQTLKRVTDFVHDRLSSRLSLADMAQVAETSLYHFAREFRRILGVPPHEYLIRARVDEAQRLLLSGVRIAETAARVGFSSQSHLTRHMRRVLGVTPGVLAQRALLTRVFQSRPGVTPTR